MTNEEKKTKNWNIKVVFEDRTIPTTVAENITFKEAVAKAEEIDRTNNDCSIGIYISRAN